jgi:hypothetical protein
MLPSRSVHTRYSRRSAGKSTSSITAAITTADRVPSGSCSNKPVRNNSVTSVSTATTSPLSCDRAPAAPFTAVLDRLPLTTIPEHRPDPRLAAPRPISSRFAEIW